ncbi:MAG TPA: alpha/beta hydrolase [Microbacteriaceae bacterium]
MTVSVTDLSFPGPHGDVPVRTYLGTASTERCAPGLVWVHGGGFSGGCLDMPSADWVARKLAERGIPVVSVSYRLAPQIDFGNPTVVPPADGVHFPVASEEIVAAFTWTLAHAGELGIDTELLSLGGSSAGANLSAGASLRLRDANGAQPHTVLLAYPVLHARLPRPSPELAEKIETLPPHATLPPEVTFAMNLNYVGDEALLADPYAFPGGHDLTGLPPTFILNSDHDSLRSSGEAYASELAMAGVDVLVLREDGTRHGHLNDPQNPAAWLSIERMSAWLHPNPLVGNQHTNAVPTIEQKVRP